jgi:hypothetical protein
MAERKAAARKTGTVNKATQATETAEAKPTLSEKQKAAEEQFEAADFAARRAVSGF